MPDNGETEVPQNQTSQERAIARPVEEVPRVSPSEIPPEFAELMDRYKNDPAQVRQWLMMFEQFSGQLPHPRHFEDYARLIPDGGNRLMVQAEKEQSHRHEMERLEAGHRYDLSRIELQNHADAELQVITAQTEEMRSERNLRSGMSKGIHFVAIFAIAMAVYSSHLGHEKLGLSIVGALTILYGGAWISHLLQKNTDNNKSSPEESKE